MDTELELSAQDQRLENVDSAREHAAISEQLCSPWLTFAMAVFSCNSLDGLDNAKQHAA